MEIKRSVHRKRLRTERHLKLVFLGVIKQQLSHVIPNIKDKVLFKLRKQHFIGCMLTSKRLLFSHHVILR